jgi:hypothetical protein
MWWFIPGPPSGFRRLDSSCSTLFRYITVCIHFAIYILTIGLEVKQLSLGSDTKFFNHRADANGSLEEGRPSSRNSSRGPQRRCRDNFPLESGSGCQYVKDGLSLKYKHDMVIFICSQVFDTSWLTTTPSKARRYAENEFWAVLSWGDGPEEHYRKAMGAMSLLVPIT